VQVALSNKWIDMGPFTSIMIMRKSNKLMLNLILLSLWGAILGGYFKITGNPNGDYILILAILFKFLGIGGLIYFNRKKIMEFLS
jgi:hypothetical protein